MRRVRRDDALYREIHAVVEELSPDAGDEDDEDEDEA